MTMDEIERYAAEVHANVDRLMADVDMQPLCSTCVPDGCVGD
jgi:hypothetical protein